MNTPLNLPRKNPAHLSRNYSGHSAYYTPPFLVKCLINWVDTLFREHFHINKGIFSEQIISIDPAAGELRFAKGLLEAASYNLSKAEFREWASQTFLKQNFGFDVDADAVHTGMRHLQKSLQGYFGGDLLIGLLNGRHYIVQNPLEAPEKSEILWEEASTIHPPILWVCGNPPYSISSTTKTAWIQGLIEDYKRELNRPGKKRIMGLKGIQDDYVKFIRYCQWLLADRDQMGIWSFVVNNYFLDGDIFRGLRKSLLDNFNAIYVVDLFGDPKKGPPEFGVPHYPEKDESVFDIQTGICLFIAVKSSRPTSTQLQGQQSLESELYRAKVYYTGCFGSLDRKRAFCSQKISALQFIQVPSRLDYEFVPISLERAREEEIYNSLPYLPDIFRKNIIGAQSLHDTLVTHPDRARLEAILTSFYDGSFDKHSFFDKKGQKWVKYQGISYHDARDWKIADGLAGSLQKALEHIQKWQWRGMDRWWVSYDSHLVTRGSSSFSLMQYMLEGQDNYALVLSRASRKANGDNSVFLTPIIAESHCIEGGSGIGDYAFPLKIGSPPYTRNSWGRVKPAAGYNIEDEFFILLPYHSQIVLEQIFWYIYAIMWAVPYRRRYRSFLKRDFPHIPFPQQCADFRLLAEMGEQLGKLHSFESPPPKSSLSLFQTSDGRNPVIFSPIYDPESQRIYFDGKDRAKSFWVAGISPEMWHFEIGGIPQLLQYLKHRICRSSNVIGGTDTPSYGKYSFHRPLNSEELHYFMQMCYVIWKTLNFVPEIEGVYNQLESTGGWLRFK